MRTLGSVLALCKCLWVENQEMGGRQREKGALELRREREICLGRNCVEFCIEGKGGGKMAELK